MSGILLSSGATLPPLNLDVPGIESRVHPLKHPELGEIMALRLGLNHVVIAQPDRFLGLAQDGEENKQLER
jgi:hypothetical protein